MWPLVYAPRTHAAYAIIPAHINYTTIPRDMRTAEHRHRVYHLMFFIDGEALIEHSRGTFSVREKDIIVIDPNDKHVFITRERDVVYFTFNFSLIQAAAAEKAGDDFAKRIREHAYIETNGETKTLAQLFGTAQNDIHIRYDAAQWDSIRVAIDGLNASRLEYFIDPSAPSYAEDVVLHGGDIAAFFHRFMLFTAYRQPSRGASGDDIAAKIVAYLKHTVEKKYSLKALAAHMKYTPNYLCGHFKKVTGMSIARYYNRLKIEQACNYLRATNLSVTDIAYRLDFSSSQHFARNFKQEKKLSPREYRERVAQ
ncbi:MAG: AraC family transcriptional regulator [Spirochaetes bacterium]|nr:AraC family transcriptional regulator [Spirochaetota bacterium]